MNATLNAPTLAKPGPHTDPATVRRAALAGLIGTTLEQYDFVIYGTASALIFNKLFFPNISPTAGILASFSAYAVGFLARPLGGLFFSRLGDRLGRKYVLVATLMLMGGATLAIGLLPTFEQVGVLAPILLVACRFLQGFGAGAEQAGGATLLTETAQIGKRGRLAALIMTGAALGTALGALAWIAAQLLPDEQLMSWGWRLVFISSIAVTIAAFVIRRKLNESPVFQELKQQHRAPRTPVREVFANGKKPLFIVMFMTIGISAQSYTYQVFMPSFLKNNVHVDPTFIPKVLLAGAICGGIAAYGFGHLSDHVGRKPVYIAIVAALVILPIPTFRALETGSHLLITAVMIVGFMLACQGAVGVTMSYFPEIFGSHYRYSGVTLGREFASIFGGGVAPLLCAALVSTFSGSWIPVAIYMMIMAATVLAASTLAPETRDRDLSTARNATDRAEIAA